MLMNVNQIVVKISSYYGLPARDRVKLCRYINFSEKKNTLADCLHFPNHRLSSAV